MARKPCVGTAIANVSEYQTGAFNIDACRIGTFRSTTPSGFDRYNAKLASQGYRPGEYQKGPPPLPATEGRWPSNLILQHCASCEPGESVSVKSSGHYPSARPSGSQTSGPSGHRGQQDLEERYTKGEEVQTWCCSEECPVPDLDQQSGIVLGSKDGGFKDTPARSWKNTSKAGIRRVGYADAGTAARFFKQVKP